MRFAALVVGIIISVPAVAQQISTLPAANLPLTGAELTYLIQGGSSKQTSVSSIIAGVTGKPGGTPGQIQLNNNNIGFSGTSTIDGFPIGSIIPSTGVFTTLTSNGNFFANYGGTNPVEITGTTIQLTGSGNPTMILNSGGTGGIQLKTSNGVQFQIINSASTVTNAIRVQGAATGSPAILQQTGDAAGTLEFGAGSGGTAGTVQSLANFIGNGYIRSLSYMLSGGYIQIGQATQTYTAGAGIAPGATNLPSFWSSNTVTGTLSSGGGSPYFLKSTDTVINSGGSGNGDMVIIDQELNSNVVTATTTASSTSSTTITVPTTGISPNMVVSGTGITGSPTVVSITNSTSLVVSSAQTISNGTLLTFTGGYDGFRCMFCLIQHKNVASMNGNSVMNTVVMTSVWAGFEGGSLTGWQGGGVNLNPDLTCNIQYADECSDQELDSRQVQQALLRDILDLHFAINDATHGYTLDSALTIDASGSIASGTGKGTVLIELGSATQVWPLDNTLTTTSKVMGIQPNDTTDEYVFGYPLQEYAAYGIDLREMYCSQYAWRSSGHWIDCAGQVFIGPGQITYGSSGLTISSPNMTEVSATVATAGSNYVVGDELIDTIGGLWSVATLSGSGVATVTLLRAGFASTCPTSPTATIGGNGVATAALTITCAASGTTQVGATAGTVILGGGSALSTSATTGFIEVPTMAGAPTGTVGAAGKAALVIDTTDKKICYSIGGGTWECSAAFTP